MKHFNAYVLCVSIFYFVLSLCMCPFCCDFYVETRLHYETPSNMCDPCMFKNGLMDSGSHVLTVGFLLLMYSVVYTAEFSSLFYLLLISQFVFIRR